MKFNVLNRLKKLSFKKKRRGFTLIEMLVTVSIIAMISGIAIVSYTKAQSKAEESVDYATAASIATAAQVALSDNPNATISMEALKSGGYLESIPTPKSVTGAFTVSATDGKIVVKVGSDTFYPKE